MSDLEEMLKYNLRLQEVFGRIAIGKELQMINPLLEAMTLVSAAKALKSGSSSLFLTQMFATIGIDKETNALGFIGPEINRLVDNLTEGLLALYTQKATIANAMLLKRIVKGVVVFALGAGTVLKLKSKAENPEIKSIYNRMVLLLVASSNVLKTTFEELIVACGGDEKTKKICAEVLSLMTLVMVGVTATDDNEKDYSAMIEVLNRYFSASLDKMDEQISHRLPSIHAVISRSKLSLANKSSEDFKEAIESALEAIDISLSDLKKEITEIEAVILSVYQAVTTELDEVSKGATEISVVV